MLRPLEGINVLDLSRILAGPHAAQSLADLGANVTKVEAPWGDDTRTWGPPFQAGFDGAEVASYFLSCNRGKSISIANIKEETHRVRMLVDQADVILENFKPGGMERLLGNVRPDQILCRISGYGQTGPRSNEPAFDLTMQARSGIMSITGEPNGQPVKVGVAWIDVMTGMNAVSSILAALFHRERTGQGCVIDLSLWDTAIAALVNQAHNALAGHHPIPMGSAHPNLVPYRVFQARDGWFAIGVGSTPQWRTLTDALNLDVPVEWDENAARITNRTAVEAVVQTAVLSHTRAALEVMLNGVPCAPVNSILEALDDPQSIARGSVSKYRGVQVLTSPLRLQPSNENSEV